MNQTQHIQEKELKTFLSLNVQHTPHGMLDCSAFIPADDKPNNVAVRLSGYYNADELRAMLQDLDHINSQLETIANKERTQ